MSKPDDEFDDFDDDFGEDFDEVSALGGPNESRHTNTAGGGPAIGNLRYFKEERGVDNSSIMQENSVNMSRITQSQVGERGENSPHDDLDVDDDDPDGNGEILGSLEDENENFGDDIDDHDDQGDRMGDGMEDIEGIEKVSVHEVFDGDENLVSSKKGNRGQKQRRPEAMDIYADKAKLIDQILNPPEKKTNVRKSYGGQGLPNREKSFPNGLNTGISPDKMATDPDMYQSQTAYTELSAKLFQEAYSNPGRAAKVFDHILSPRAEENHDGVLRSDQEHLSERLLMYKKQQEDRQKVKQEEYMKEKERECTFKPKTNHRDKPRSFQEFLDSQTRHTRQKEEKIKSMQVQKESEENFEVSLAATEKVCKGSKRILKQRETVHEDHSKSSVHERLYTANKNQFQKQLQDAIGDVSQVSQGNDRLITLFNSTSHTPRHMSKLTAQDPELSFHPKIYKKAQAIVRTEKIDDLLYNDAKRRQQTQEEAKQKKSFVKIEDAQLSSSSQKYLLQKFYREYQATFGEDYDLTTKLTYLRVGELLKKLGFLTDGIDDQEKHSLERLQLFDMWRVLKGEENSGVTLKNLRVFLTGVLGLYHPSMSHKDQIKGGNNIEVYKSTLDASRGNEGHHDEFNSQLQDHSVHDGTEQDQESPDREEHLDGSGHEDVDRVGHFKKVTYGKLESAQINTDGKHFGDFDIENGSYHVTQKHVKNLHQEFKLFTQNRAKFEQKVSSQKLTYKEANSYQPAISEKTKKLASDKRTKNLVSSKGNSKSTSHLEYLSQARTQQLHERERRKKEQEEKKVQECTFRPKTKEYKRPKNENLLISYKDIAEGTSNSRVNEDADSVSHLSETSKTGSRAVTKTEHLYKLGVQKRQNRHGDKSAQEYDFEKNSSECTFAPNISVTKNKALPTKKTVTYTAAQEKEINRLKKARDEKTTNPNKDEFLSRGYDTQMKFGVDTIGNSKFTTTFANSKAPKSTKYSHIGAKINTNRKAGENFRNDVSPLMLIDVNLGPDQVERITIYRDDTVEDLVRAFSLKHNLDAEAQKRLAESLEAQIRMADSSPRNGQEVDDDYGFTSGAGEVGEGSAEEEDDSQRHHLEAQDDDENQENQLHDQEEEDTNDALDFVGGDRSDLDQQGTDDHEGQETNGSGDVNGLESDNTTGGVETGNTAEGVAV